MLGQGVACNEIEQQQYEKYRGRNKRRSGSMTIKKKNKMILFIILTMTLSVTTGCSDAHKADPAQGKKMQSIVTNAQEDINAAEDFTEAFMAASRLRATAHCFGCSSRPLYVS